MIQLTPHNPYEIILEHPFVAAAGSLGFGVHTAATIQQVQPAALITPSITMAGRSPNGPNTLHEHRGGLLYAEPWHDPGVQWLGRRATPVWATWTTPVIVSLAGDDAEVVHAIRALDQVEGVAGFEVALAPSQLSCEALLQQLRRAATLPLFVKIPLADPHLLLPLVAHCGAANIDALTLCGAPRVATGGYLSPALFPLVLYACQTIASHTTLPIMACGGINDYASARACLNAGASAIQLGSLLLRDPDAIRDLRAQTRI